MSQIYFKVSKNGNIAELQENLCGNSIGDLLKSLKAMKESSNDALTKLVHDDNVKKSVEKDNETDDEKVEMMESREKKNS